MKQQKCKSQDILGYKTLVAVIGATIWMRKT